MRIKLWIIFLSLSFGLNAQIPMEGLQGYWPFNGSADEFFENENNGIVNGATLTQDRCGNPTCAYNFDGVNDFIECSTDSLEVIDEISISLWIKKSEMGVGADIAVSKFSEFTFDSGYNIQFDANGAAEIRGRDRNEFFSESDNNNISLLDDEWHHLVGIVDKSTWRIYVDNVLVGSFDNGHSMVNIGASANNLRFGRRSSNSSTLPPNFYKGDIDDIFIYNRAISLDEINTLYELDCNVAKETDIDYIGCINDGFEIEVNNVIYNQANPVGVEVIPLEQCIDSIIQVNLNFQEQFRDTVSYFGCQGDGFEVLVGSTLYNESLPQGEEILMNQNDCDSIIQVNLNFQEIVTETIAYIGCEGDGFEVLVGSTLYNESLTQGEELLISQNGCDSIINIDLVFQDLFRDTVSYFGCEGDGFEVLVGSTLYNESLSQGQEIIMNQNDCDSIIQVNLNFQNLFRDTVSYFGCQGDGFEVLVGSTLYNESLPQGEEILMNQNDCDSIIQVNLNFQEIVTETIAYIGCEGDGFEVLVGSTLYNESLTQGEELLISQNGCDSIVIIDLFFEDEVICMEDLEVKLPNIFTPGSSDNNIFRIRAPDNVVITNLQIYDRWGNQIYDNDNPEQEWDGTIDGQPAPSDVYIYTVTYIIPGMDPISKSSDLTLLR